MKNWKHPRTDDIPRCRNIEVYNEGRRCEELPTVPEDKYADFPRSIAHRAGLPFHTAGVYHYETSATKSFTSALFLADIITGDANSAANQRHKKQLVLNPMFSVLSAATEDLRNAVNILQTDPTNVLATTAETIASLNYKTGKKIIGLHCHSRVPLVQDQGEETSEKGILKGSIP